MNDSFLRAEYLILLDALDRGILPNEKAIGDLVEMGILEQTAQGVDMSIAARMQLAHLRSAAAVAGITTYGVDERGDSQAN